MIAKHRYVVFGSSAHDEMGGWDDFIGAFDDVQAAKDFALEYTGPFDRNPRVIGEWAQIVDLETFEEVKSERPMIDTRKAEDTCK